MIVKKWVLLVLVLLGGRIVKAQELSRYNLVFPTLPGRWDEALPLGNGMLGALIWQKGQHLRFSLDRADLWDERQALDLSKFNFSWVEKQVLQGTYDTVQQLGDAPYEASPFPTKIPAAALEFNTAELGKVASATLDIQSAMAKIVWENGAELKTFVHATRPYGAFQMVHVSKEMRPQMILPAYQGQKDNSGKNSVAGQDLSSLGYQKGALEAGKNYITYIQPGSQGLKYEVSVRWHFKKDTLEGAWSISVIRPDIRDADDAATVSQKMTNAGFKEGLQDHLEWWQQYWAASSVSLPDSTLQKQYYLEMYKFGAVARRGAPPITLQAVWTADNGSLPPWKGDIHNDLNTQLSYWPAYSGNHLKQAASFTDWLWKVKKENERYTQQYFGVEGLNVPGVATLSGVPMGGWIQYSLSPTVSAWLSQHFYWQWKYSGDSSFLKNRAYPYLHGVATFLSGITELKNGKRQLPLSSSPEIHDNSIKAWFTHGNTNYDLALMKFAFNAAAEVAEAVGKVTESKKWRREGRELPAFAVDSTGLMIAPGEDRTASHRHHSNLMAIYPLGLLNPANVSDKAIIDRSLSWLEKTGTRAWCGYSFSWAACLYARARDGEKAARALSIFATNFCSPNSFHLNGDQKGGQYSGFTYRPFTLEGNFAFVQGVQEMLLQSYSGCIEVFAAVPGSWTDIAFQDLRAEGAFLVSASRSQGSVKTIKIKAQEGGTARLRLPFKSWTARQEKGVLSRDVKDGVLTVRFKKGGEILLESRRS